MTMTQSAVLTPPRQLQKRNFPTPLVLAAAAELALVGVTLRVSGTPAFYPAAIACSLCSVQLGILLINRFSVNTRNIRRLARTAEFSSQPTFVTDPLGRIKWTNPRFTRLTGYGLSEIVGKTFAIVLHGQETDHYTVEKIRERMRAELPFESEIMIYDRAGLSLWVCCKGHPVHDNQGKVTHYLITQTDVTEERRQSRQIIDALTRNAPSETTVPKMNSTNNRVEELTRKLESLGDTDQRSQLESAIEHLKAGVETCVKQLPAEKTATSPATVHRSIGTKTSTRVPPPKSAD